MQHHVILSVTHPLTADVTKYSVVRYGGDYTVGEPILGVALEDGKAGELGSIAVRGILPVKIATGETLEVGDLLDLDENGQGVAHDSSNNADFSTVFKISKGYALVII